MEVENGHHQTIKKGCFTMSIESQDLDYIRRKFDKNFSFDDKTILITGAAGFIGYYFSKYFVSLGDIGIHPKRVILTDNFLLGHPKWIDKMASFDNVYVENFDISTDNLEDLKHAAEAEYIIHLASIASPIYYRKYPIETMDANIVGLKRILEFYLDKPVKGILFFSSSEIYGTPDGMNIPTDEEYRGLVSCTGPRACYDESKRAGEAMCRSYAEVYDLPIIVVRPFNDFGPGMRLDDFRVPADFAYCVLNGKDIKMLSDGRPTRTFCYIADAIYGYLQALVYGKYDYFNIGHESPELSISEFAMLYQRIANTLYGYEGDIIRVVSEDKHYLTDNPQRRCPSIEKARRLLNFYPEITVEAGIERYLRWLKEEGFF
jgi:UDP-glucuronate decarboxylase